jgi:hypothetical protein
VVEAKRRALHGAEHRSRINRVMAGGSYFVATSSRNVTATRRECNGRWCQDPLPNARRNPSRKRCGKRVRNVSTNCDWYRPRSCRTCWPRSARRSRRNPDADTSQSWAGRTDRGDTASHGVATLRKGAGTLRARTTSARVGDRQCRRDGNMMRMRSRCRRRCCAHSGSDRAAERLSHRRAMSLADRGHESGADPLAITAPRPLAATRRPWCERPHLFGRGATPRARDRGRSHHGLLTISDAVAR